VLLIVARRGGKKIVSNSDLESKDILIPRMLYLEATMYIRAARKDKVRSVTFQATGAGWPGQPLSFLVSCQPRLKHATMKDKRETSF